MISDILKVDSTGTEFERPIYAGNAILKVKVNGKEGAVKIVSVRTTAFDKAEVGESEEGYEVVEIKAEEPAEGEDLNSLSCLSDSRRPRIADDLLAFTTVPTKFAGELEHLRRCHR